MNELDTLRTSFVAFIDGLWWGLRDHTGPLSMYEGYARGFKQIGLEVAEKVGGKGAISAAEITGKLFSAIGLDVSVDKAVVTVEKCPIWDRILERGLEYAFHIEEICWIPMLEGIGERTGAEPEMVSALRLVYVEKAKVEHKKRKAKSALDKGQISRDEYDKQIVMLDQTLKDRPTVGKYQFK